MQALKVFKTSGLVWLWLAVIVIIIDRLSKVWVLHNLTFFEPVAVLPFFNLTLAYNTGAAFSFLNKASGWQNWFLGGLAICISIIIILWLARTPRRETWMNIALSLIVAGALGNVWDRMLYGYVVDFLSFHWGDWHFAIFNIADAAICIGSFMLIWYWLRNRSDA